MTHVPAFLPDKCGSPGSPGGKLESFYMSPTMTNPVMRGSCFNRRSSVGGKSAPGSPFAGSPFGSPHSYTSKMYGDECTGNVLNLDLVNPLLLPAEDASGEGWSRQVSPYYADDPANIDQRVSITTGLVYGMVNFVICVPTLISYTQIVFYQQEFKPVVPLLVKLYFLSSSLHQLVFAARSTLEFAVGQVQDVGLIFLAAMVRNIVKWGKADGLSDDEVVATSLWQCAGSTTIVGICVVLVGKFKISEYVQMLPKPVVGGYLGYIGYFCLVAGMQISTGLEFPTPGDLVQLFDHRLVGRLALLALFTVILAYINFHVDHFMAMPVALIVLPAAFFMALPVLGVSVDECRAGGWLPQPSETTDGLGIFPLFKPDAVRWNYLPQQGVNIVGLIIVVAFGSSLDIAAVQEARPSRKLDYNNELMTVGWANLLSGLTGGATGSYIFSQTIFSAKKGVQSRSNGLAVFFGEFILFLAPIDVVRWLPNAYVGAIMCLFGIDIMADWLFFSRSSMAPAEYFIVWFSFVCVMWFTTLDAFGVIEGMFVSTISAAFIFSIRYAMAHRHWTILHCHSSVVRPWRERNALANTQDLILTIGLKGYAFFLSSLPMAQAIEAEAKRRDPIFFCLDFARVQGLDSTAVGQLKFLLASLEREGMKVLLSSINTPWLFRLLEAQHIWGTEEATLTGRKAFATLDMSLQYCEEMLLRQRHLTPTSAMIEEKRVEELLLEYVENFSKNHDRDERAAIELSNFFDRKELSPGDVIFGEEDPADYIYVVACGRIEVSTQKQGLQYDEHMGAGAILGDTAYHAHGTFGCRAVVVADKISHSPCIVRRISRQTIESLEESKPHLVVFFQKVLLRDLTQYQVQFLEPNMVANGAV